MIFSRRKPHEYIIEVAAQCNLRCPSCPNGNSDPGHRPTANMDVELFRQIVAKIAQDNPNVEMLQLYNWSEPLLHPELPLLVEEAKRVGLPCAISSNLNVSVDRLVKVVDAGVDSIRVSISGTEQESYGFTHAGGHIDVVKRNLRALHDAVASSSRPPDVQVLYHLYTHNTGAQLDEVVSLCDEYGFQLATCWAYLMPIEQQLACLRGEFTGEGSEVLDRLAIKPQEARDVSARQPGKGCILRETQLVINTDGSVEVCCAVFGDGHRVAPSFLDSSWQRIALAKRMSAICRNCMKDHVQKTVLYAGSDDLNAIALRRLAELGAEVPKVLPKFQ